MATSKATESAGPPPSDHPLPLTKPRTRARLEQERSIRTRAALLQAAQRLFVTRGYEGASIREIAAAAGVSKGNFYFYFPTKAALVAELGVLTTHRVLEDKARDAPPEATTAGLLRGLVATFAERISKTPRELAAQSVIELFHSISRRRGQARGEEDELLTELGGILLRGQVRGEVRGDQNLVDAALLIELSILQAIVVWADEPDENLDDVMWRTVRVVARGISTDPWEWG